MYLYYAILNIIFVLCILAYRQKMARNASDLVGKIYVY